MVGGGREGGGGQQLTTRRQTRVSPRVSDSQVIKAEAGFEGHKEGKCKRTSLLVTSH